jgi:translation initiation factor 2 subunit 2
MAALEEAAPTQDEEVAAMFDLSKMKKKKKKKKVEESVATNDSKFANYTYDQLLDRVAKIIEEKNPELGEKRRHTMKPPQLMRVGTKKTLWVNYVETCNAMNRSPEHVFTYFMAELGTDGSPDDKGRLTIKGKYMPKYIESLLRKYIVEYVTCTMCRSPQTTLTRDSHSRLYFLHCQKCGSSRSVTPIRAGFHAQTRADRRALRK